MLPKLFLTLSATAVAIACMAGPAAADTGDASQLKAYLAKTYPNTPISEIKASPVPGVFQVTMGRTVAFADKTGRYFIFGPMFDMHEQVDLTAETRNELNRAKWDALPLDLAFTVTKGDGSRKFAVFSDPDCTFCRRLERELLKLDNYTMHVFLSPVAALHPEARQKAQSVWCAKDRAVAWTSLMVEGIAPSEATCDNPLDKIELLTRELGVSGTPSLVRDDGTFKAGFMPVAALDAWLNDSSVRR
jgi:thiol:disulfide interchange protein DsbC